MWNVKRRNNIFIFYLKEHPEISTSMNKEVHYFNLNYKNGIEWYEKENEKIKINWEVIIFEISIRISLLPIRKQFVLWCNGQEIPDYIRLTKIKKLSVIAIFLYLAHSFTVIQFKLECKWRVQKLYSPWGEGTFLVCRFKEKFVLWQYFIIKEDFDLKLKKIW